MVKPQFIQEIRQHGRVVESREPVVLNPAICSDETLTKIKDMLEGVVERGTATNLKSSLVSIAGKTGTCQQNYWKEYTYEYQASFAGYFPSENPKYSCIVVINKPNYHRGYYGSTVAAPVFKAIAENIYLDIPKKLEPHEAVRNFAMAGEKEVNKLSRISRGKALPDLTGLDGSEVLPVLENNGFKVKTKGIGKVQWQYPPAGTQVSTKTLIGLKLG